MRRESSIKPEVRPSIAVLGWVRCEEEETDEDLMRLLHCTGANSVQINSHAMAVSFKQQNSLGGCLQFVGKKEMLIHLIFKVSVSKSIFLLPGKWC